MKRIGNGIIIFFGMIGVIFYVCGLFGWWGFKAGWYWIFNRKKYHEFSNELNRL